jgi:ppGpp synthetase/RelA/SpoT-type nucleotidyltranferase
MDCELLWIALAPAIDSEFSKDDLQSFFQAYLTDHHPLDAIQQRAKNLKSLLRKLYREAEPEQKLRSVRDAVERFEQAKADVAGVQLSDPHVREYLEIELEDMMHRHLEQVIQQMGMTS